jgi:hypothetical protein
MEKTRTLYRLRKMKNGVLINLFTLFIGSILFTFLVAFESDILSLMRERATGLLNGGDGAAINLSLDLCEKAFNYLKTTSNIAILLSLEGFVMIFFFVRMSSKTWKFSKFAPSFLGIGTLLIFSYYLLLGISLPSTGQLNSFESSYQLLKYAGVLLVLTANILFVYQVFIQVVLEKFDE